jgi:hypothetical protein
MNDLLTRDYHEVIGDIIKIDMNQDFRLGSILLDRIPYNFIGEQEELFKNKTEDNPLAMSEDELKKLIPKLNFNLPDTKLRFIEKKLIEEKNYMDLMELYKDEYPYKNMDSIHLYSYCRTLIGNPISSEEYSKIRQDLKSIKRNMKKIESKQMKKKNGVYSLDF